MTAANRLWYAALAIPGASLERSSRDTEKHHRGEFMHSVLGAARGCVFYVEMSRLGIDGELQQERRVERLTQSLNGS